jgi:predicted ribosome quality control (RQC) complex YloA/Tae2 family protein
MWLSTIKIDQIEENKLVRRLRDDLTRLKIAKIEQIGLERIAYLRFSGFDKEFVLICEFFGDGNIILCNKDLKILALLHSIEVRHRELQVGMIYTPPPQKGLNILDISEKDFNEFKSSSTPIVKWFGRTFGLPSKYAEEILRVAKIDFDTSGSSLTDDKTKEIVAAAKTLTQKVMSGNHEPVIVKSKDSLDVYPIILNAQDSEYERIPSFMEGLDKVFSKILLEKGKASQSSSLDKKINDIQSRIDEQNKAILQVKDLSGKISSVAKSLFGLSSRGVTTIADPAAVEMLKSQNAEIVKEKGLDYIKIDGERIQIRTDASIPAIASTLFDESKRQSSAIASIESLKAKNQKELAKI